MNPRRRCCRLSAGPSICARCAIAWRACWPARRAPKDSNCASPLPKMWRRGSWETGCACGRFWEIYPPWQLIHGVRSGLPIDCRRGGCAPGIAKTDIPGVGYRGGHRPDALKSLFKPFVQAGPSISRRYGGTGLGLSICQRLVKLMGGEISIESAPSRGTTVRFSVEFPMYLQPPDESANPASPLCVEAHDREQMPHPHRPPASAPRILVAEDHPVNRLLLRQQLTQLGYTCDTVENGAQALDALAQHSYALLITDCQMPEMDGYQLAEHIRANEKAIHAAQSLPILAITANTLRSEQARCLKAGINDYLLKPVQLDTLAQRIRQWIAPSGAHREPDAQDDKDLEHFSASSYGERIAAQGKPLKNALDTLIQSLKPLYRDHPAQLRALLLTLAESLRADLVRLHEQLNAPPPLDRARLRQWIHRQSGAFAIFGHTPFTAQFDTLRASAQHAPDDALRTEARALARALELFAQRLELELEHFSMRIFDHELHA